MRKITVVRKKHRLGPRATRVYIGRGSPLGNPFIIGRDGTRAEVIKKFEEGLATAGPEVQAELARINDIAGDVELECFCAPGPCHGDVVRAVLQGMAPKIESPEDCVAALQARGLKAVLFAGIPLVPSAACPTPEDKYTAINIVEQLGLSASIFAEGMFVTPHPLQRPMPTE